jgi:DnaK suppressor protein
MNLPNAAPYREQLVRMRADLLAQISEQRGGVVGRAEVAAAHFGRPEDSSAQLATERDIEFALGERETAELGAIDAALARVTAGTYGACTDCTNPIAPARLQSTPEAPRCIHCQEKAEQMRHA